MSTSFPPDLPVELDRSTQSLEEGTILMGGEPMRFLRLSPTGAAVLRQLTNKGAGSSAAARALARRLLDTGLAHPKPNISHRQDVTVVIPVRDRADALDACLAASGGPAIVVDDGSADANAISFVCAKHGARIVRREVSSGPASARNAGLELVSTPLVAFLDSDCVPEPKWLERLVGHFADPSVVAVAPRIRAVSSATGPIARFAVARSPIDLGANPSRVVPMGKVSYVPTAALLVRKSAIERAFDDELRFGEDVDFVWRLHERGMTVRFDPSVSVFHREPTSWARLLLRHFKYGSSAAALARRHPGQLAHVVLDPWSCVLAMAALSGRLRLASAVVAARVGRITSTSLPTGFPRSRLALQVVGGAAKMTLGVGHALAMFAPGLLFITLRDRRTRLASLFLLFAPPTFEWYGKRPSLDPMRWAFLCLVDDAAYGLGVWAGCVRSRTLEPVLPRWQRRVPTERGRS